MPLSTIKAVITLMKVNILALDSASAVCGISALCFDKGQATVYSAQHSGSTQHAERILPLVEQVLEQAQIARQDLHAIAFAQGPGGFTGLRVACGVAQGIAHALGLQIAAVPSLLAIGAQQEPTTAPTIELVVVDARMQEIYLGAYQRTATGWYSLHKPVLISVDQLHHYIQQLNSQLIDLGLTTAIRLSGDALQAFDGLCEAVQQYDVLIGTAELARAETIAQLGLLAYQQNQLIDPALAAPLYVRNRVAFTIVEREQGLGGNPSATWQSVQLRALEVDDISQVVAIEASLQQHPWSATQFESSLSAGHFVWVATFAGQVVAYAVVMLTVDESELLLIGVSESHQRQGIAQQLLCYAEQAARAKGSVKMHLEVRVSNSAAIELYQGAGYRQVGLRKNYYSTDTTQREHAALYTKVLA
ncbi:tRNA (adenosine(37)-N6)-threonylcarbamoyltransferase complex dimerization subunit type 1 TsaB [uncultured Paenalcaligenes sp.]|uniref:tRNA (adenosine(37)-N6)-threonylcarbamoyltransferase complex dimerization subunit type 1 TsaB n=1 Tax=uncultured Paenalcaligenes sp. TaxID=1588925 RepID=UPI00261DD8D4|nr:tRNA (adenosine(37)-N6)-threonylcarbamoyltransferase complex dimerization subunit type 1 TsaB [uncultured Paenalcaligenes sp.]